MKTIVVAANKGGVGKTTSTLSLAAGLQKKGYKILLIDTDPQANLSLVMGMDREEKEKIGRNVATWLLGMREYAEVVINKEGIDLIPATRQVAGLEKQIAADINSNFLLKKALSPLDDSYDYCLIDTAPGMGTLILASLVAAQYVLIPCEPEFLSIEGLSTFFALIASIKEYQNKDLQVAGVFFTKYSPTYRTGLHKKYYADTKEDLKEILFETTIRENISLAESQSFQTSIFDYAPESNGAKDYSLLLSELLERIQPKARLKAKTTKQSMKNGKTK